MNHKHIRVYERDRIYPQSIAPYLKLIKFSPQKHYYIANGWEVMVYLNDYFWWARDTDYLEKAARRWFDVWLKSTKIRAGIVNSYNNDHSTLTKKFLALKKMEVNQLDNFGLLKLYRGAVNGALSHLTYGEYTSDLFDDYFGKVFNEYLVKVTKDKITTEDLSEFLQPATVSTGTYYHQAILKLSLTKSCSVKQVKKLVEKFSWIKMSWDGSNEFTAEDVIKEIKGLQKKEPTDIRYEINKFKNYKKIIQQKRNKLLKKYGLNKKSVQKYFDLLDEFNIFHDYRKEIQMRSNQVIYCVLKEIPKRFKLKYKDLMFYSVEEIEGLLGKSKLVNFRQIAKRRQGITWLIQKGRVKEYLGNEAKKKLEELVLSVVRTKKVKEIKGLPASRGKYKGRAFVTNSAKDANHFLKKGEILVTSMTTVDYLPAMKRAGAVVTDDGGATCHAAVVAREFSIPCVVGTKVATQVFKTGDKMRVDANLGIIEKV